MFFIWIFWFGIIVKGKLWKGYVFAPVLHQTFESQCVKPKSNTLLNDPYVNVRKHWLQKTPVSKNVAWKKTFVWFLDPSLYLKELLHKHEESHYKIRVR